MSVEYIVDERSLIYGFLKKHLWTRMLSWIPLSMSANTLTLLGALTANFASLLLFVRPSARWSWGVASVLYFAFLCIDNLDGAQARRTGGGSPLGEVLDHWLDGITGGVVFMAVLRAMEVTGPRAWIIVALGSLSYVLTFWEQRVTGKIIFAALGNAEGLVAMSGLCAAGAIFGPETVRRTALIGTWTIVDAFFVLTLVSTLYTVAAPLVRVRRDAANILTMLLPYAALLAWAGATRVLPDAAVLLLFVFLTPATAGRMLLSRVLQRPELRANLPLCLGTALAATLAIGLRLAPATQRAMLLALVLYAVARAALDLIGAIRALVQYLRPGELLALAFGSRR